MGKDLESVETNLYTSAYAIVYMFLNILYIYLDCVLYWYFFYFTHDTQFERCIHFYTVATLILPAPRYLKKAVVRFWNEKSK